MVLGLKTVRRTVGGKKTRRAVFSWRVPLAQASYKSIPSSGMRQAEFVRVTRVSVLILLGLVAHPGNVSDIDLHDVLGKPAVDQVLHFVGDLVERELPGAIEQF